MSTILKTKNVSRILDGEIPVSLVKDASMEINSGEFVVITGPSGSGKSSLLYLLGLLDSPSSGHMWFQGKNVEHYNDNQRAQLRLAHMGFVFQFHFLLPEFSALENVMLPMRRLGKLKPGQMKERARELLHSLGLGDQTHKCPQQLSGGQSQRVAVARALANDPSLILADEPTGNLDTKASDTVRSILMDVTKNSGRAVVTVTHDMNFARDPDRLITIVDGTIQP